MDFTKTLSFETLEDYAVSENSAVFLQNNRIIKYSGERLETLTNGKEEITHVYYDGVFRYTVLKFKNHTENLKKFFNYFLIMPFLSYLTFIIQIQKRTNVLYISEDR